MILLCCTCFLNIGLIVWVDFRILSQCGFHFPEVCCLDSCLYLACATCYFCLSLCKWLISLCRTYFTKACIWYLISFKCTLRNCSIFPCVLPVKIPEDFFRCLHPWLFACLVVISYFQFQIYELMCILCRIVLNVLEIFIQWFHWQCCEMDESNFSYSSNVKDECCSSAAWCHIIHYESNEYFMLTASDMHIWLF